MHEHRHGAVRAVALAVLLGAHDALEHAVDGLQVRGVRGEVDLDLFTRRRGEGALRTEVVLDVTRALHVAGILRALELAEDLAVGLARDVGEHVEATAVRHADGDLVELIVGSLLHDLVKQRNQRLATLEAEALLADVLRLQEGFERLGLVELAQDAYLLIVRRLLVRLLEPRLEPASLLGVLDVHVLDAHRAAVRVAQHTENLARQHRALAPEAAGDELAVEVPEGEAVARDVEVGVAALLVGERVDVGHHVPAHPERVDQLVNARRLVDLVGEVNVNVLRPVNRVVRDAQVGEDLFVEIALTDQQLVHLLQELAAAGALDDAVVVGARQRDRLADTQLGESRLRHALELGGVLESARADDGALALHEARHRVHGADAARVRERDRVALEVGGGELVVTGALDDVFVGGVELAERHRLGLLDAGNQQGPRAVGLRDIDRDAEVDVGRRHDHRLAVVLVVIDVLARELAQCPHHGPRDQVGE